MWDSSRKKQENISCLRTPYSFEHFYQVVMRYTCQVTNQSSHGELSFHHNPYLLLVRDLGLSSFRVIRRGGSRLKNAAHPSYCHCCELCALKQKPGVLLDKQKRLWRSLRGPPKAQKTKPKSQLQTVLITSCAALAWATSSTSNVCHASFSRRRV